jgi:hypothetical protein
VPTGHLERSSYVAWKTNSATPIGFLRAINLTAALVAVQTRSAILGRARNMGRLDEIDIYRLCGLKSRYQDQLFEAA